MNQRAQLAVYTMAREEECVVKCRERRKSKHMSRDMHVSNQPRQCGHKRYKGQQTHDRPAVSRG